MGCSTTGFSVLHYLPEFASTHVHWVHDDTQPSRPLSPPSPPPSSSTRWPKYWSFRFSISPSNEYSGLISFRIDWFDLLAVQGTLKSLLQHHNLKASILCNSKVHIVKAMVFPVVMYGCDSWTIKKAEHRRIDFKLWCWRTILRVPWTAWRVNESILKEINSEYSLEGLMLNLKLQYFGHLRTGRLDLLEKTLMLGKTEGRRRD